MATIAIVRACSLIALVVTVFSTGPHCSGQTPALSMQEASWLEMLDDLLPVIQEAGDPDIRNYYEALIRTGILHVRAGSVDSSIDYLNMIAEIAPPHSLPWGINRFAVEKAIVERLAAEGDVDQVLEFILNTVNEPSHPELWHDSVLTAIRSGNTASAQKLLERFNDLEPSDVLPADTKSRVLKSVELERAVAAATNGDAEVAIDVFEDLLAREPEPVKSYSPFGGSPYPRHRGHVAVLESMIRHGFAERAMEVVRERWGVEDSKRGRVPHVIQVGLLEAGHLEYAREVVGMVEGTHQRAYAFVSLAAFNVRSGQQMEAELDLQQGLEVLQQTLTRPSIQLLDKIAEVYELLGDDEQADETRKTAFSRALRHQSVSPLQTLIESQMERGETPSWKFLLEEKRLVSSISELVKVAHWFYTNGDSETARDVCEAVENVGLAYGAGAAIAGDGMRTMRSDIWARMMVARAWAGTGEWRRSLELLKETDERHRYEGVRMIARSYGQKDEETLTAWIDGFGEPEMQAYAIIGVLENRLGPNRQASIRD